MKGTIFKKWVVILVILSIYFTTGIQGMDNDENNLKKKLLKKPTQFFDCDDNDDNDERNKIEEDYESTGKKYPSDYQNDLNSTMAMEITEASQKFSAALKDSDLDDYEQSDYYSDNYDLGHIDAEKENYYKYLYPDSRSQSKKTSPDNSKSNTSSPDYSKSNTWKSFPTSQYKEDEEKIKVSDTLVDGFEMEDPNQLRLRKESQNQLNKKQPIKPVKKEYFKSNSQVFILGKENPAKLDSQLDIHTYEEIKEKNRKSDKDNAAQLLSDGIKYYKGDHQDLLKDVEKKFGTKSARTRDLFEFLCSKEKIIDDNDRMINDDLPNKEFHDSIRSPKQHTGLKKMRSFNNFKQNRLPWQFQKDTHVLVQLENPKHDFLKTLLVFANPSKYTKPVWNNEAIKTKVENYLKKCAYDKNMENSDASKFAIDKLEAMKKNKKCIYRDGMEYIIQLIPDIFGINVAIYGMDRKILKFIEINVQTLHLIYIISDGHGHFYPARRVKDLKSEFATSNVAFDDHSVTFSPFHTLVESTLSENLSMKEDYLDLARAISASPYYNPYKDHREKIPEKRERLKSIKNVIETYLKSSEQEKEDHEITKYVEELQNTREEFVPAYLRLEDHDIYGLAKCFDLYVGIHENDWMQFDDDRFEKTMENCRTYKIENGKVIRNVKMTAEELINFYYWYTHKLRISHESIKALMDARKKNTAWLALGTLVLVVIPCCSFWKSEYMRLHPGEAIYDIKLGHYPVLLFAYWSIYSFIYFSLVNPFLQHEIAPVNAIKYNTNSKSFMAKICPSYGTKNCVDKVFFLQPVRKFLWEAHDHMDDWLNARDLKTLMLVLFIVNTISYACLEPIRDVFGLTRVIPPKFPFYEEFIHAPLELGKIFALVFGGKTIGGFAIPDMLNVDSAGEFISMTLSFYGTKMMVIFLLTPAVALAKLIRVSFIACGTAIANYRCCRPLVTEFKKFFHTRYNHKQGACEFFKNNSLSIFSQFGVMGFFYMWQRVFTTKWIQEDLSYFMGVSFGLVIWDLLKYTTNMLNHQFYTISESVPRDNNEDGQPLGPAKGCGNFIKYYRTQLFLMVFTVFIPLFYAHFGVDALADLQYVFELGLEFLGGYMYLFVANNIYLAGKTISSRCANYNYSDDQYETEDENENE